MNKPSDLVVDVVAIRRNAGTRRRVESHVHLGDVSVGDVAVVDGLVAVDVVVEAITEGMAVSGTVRAHWSGSCRRCLIAVEGDIETDIREIFEHEPTEGETWPIADEKIDVAPAVRESLILALPLAPLCRESCRGPEPDRFPTGPPDDAEPSGDPRWAVLDELRFDQ